MARWARICRGWGCTWLTEARLCGESQNLTLGEPSQLMRKGVKWVDSLLPMAQPESGRTPQTFLFRNVVHPGPVEQGAAGLGAWSLLVSRAFCVPMLLLTSRT